MKLYGLTAIVVVLLFLSTGCTEPNYTSEPVSREDSIQFFEVGSGFETGQLNPTDRGKSMFFTGDVMAIGLFLNGFENKQITIELIEPETGRQAYLIHMEIKAGPFAKAIQKTITVPPVATQKNYILRATVGVIHRDIMVVWSPR